MLATLLSGVLVWLFRTWIAERLKGAIKNEYDQKLETHKAELKGLHDTELERLRADLRIEASERETRFDRHHEKVIEIVAGTFAQLQEFHRAIASYLIDPLSVTSSREVWDSAKGKFDAFYDYFNPRRIYLSKKTAEGIDRTCQKLLKVLFVDGLPVPEDVGSCERVKQAYARLVEEVIPLLKSLEEEFRTLVGPGQPPQDDATRLPPSAFCIHHSALA